MDILVSQPLIFLFLATINLLVCGLAGQLIGGLVNGYLGGMNGKTIETTAIPNQGMWQTIKNGVILAVTGCLLLTLLFKLLGIPMPINIILGLSFGIPAFIALIKHFILRLLLYVNGYAPWNYVRFLDYGINSILLQKIGGGYIFTHRLLLEHFAQFSIEKQVNQNLQIVDSFNGEVPNDNFNP